MAAARFECPFCGGQELEEKDVYVRIYYRAVAEWGEDGRPTAFGEGAWGEVEHLEEDLGRPVDAVEPEGRFICASCDRSFDRPTPRPSSGEAAAGRE